MRDGSITSAPAASLGYAGVSVRIGDQKGDSSGINLDFFFFSSRRRHTRLTCDWSSDVCSSDLRGARDFVQSSRGQQGTAATAGGHEACAGAERCYEKREEQSMTIGNAVRKTTIAWIASAALLDRKSVV